MTDGEMFPFMEVFRSLTRVFPLRGEDRELRDVGASYFKAMRRFPLDKVNQGADRCVQQLKRFPKPAEWIEMIPRHTVSAAPAALTTLEASEWLDAERKRWEDASCGCSMCRAANVSHRPIRFVPEFNEHGQDARVQLDHRTVTRGHWAHGAELARWYAARDDFYAKFKVLVARHGFKKRTREPGEEG